MQSDSCQNRSLVPATCTDFQNSALARYPGLFGHQCNHVWLGDRLSISDRKGSVGVRPAAHYGGDEGLAGDRPHGGEDSAISHTSPLQVLPHHAATLSAPVG